MPLTKINSEVVNIVDVSNSLKNAADDGGVRDYIDDQLSALNSTLTVYVDGEVANINSSIAAINLDIDGLQADVNYLQTHMIDYVSKAANLSDINAGTARTNLSVYSKSETDSLLDAKASLAFFTDPANRSLNTNGYQIFPGGIMIQWGYNSGNKKITFPKPFSTVCASCTGTITSGHWEGLSITNLTKTDFNSYSRYGDGFFWMAIGW